MVFFIGMRPFGCIIVQRIAMNHIRVCAVAVFCMVLFAMSSAMAGVGEVLSVNNVFANLRDGPGKNYASIMQVTRNTMVIERSRRGDWVAVEIPGNGRRGWIHSSLLARTAIKSSPAEKKSIVTQVHSTVPSQSAKGLSTKVGVIDLQRILDQSQEGKRAKQLFTDLSASTAADDLKRTEQQLIRRIFDEIAAIVARYAKQEGFTQVVDVTKGGIVFTDERFDITDQIIELYDKRTGSASEESPRPEQSEGGGDG